MIKARPLDLPVYLSKTCYVLSAVLYKAKLGLSTMVLKKNSV